jgi:hypothetical protein
MKKSDSKHIIFKFNSLIFDCDFFNQLIGKSLIILAFTSFLILTSEKIQAQNNDEIAVPAKIIDGDTIPCFSIQEVPIFSFKTYKTAKDEQVAKRLINNVKKVYPYAKLAAAKMKYYDQLAQKAPNEREKNRINKQAEEDLKNQFEADIKSMTRSQGKLLIKLIDRETGKTSYEIIKLSRGSFRAIFWQSMGSFFGMDLKEKYDKEGDDATIERIVQLIEKGII